MWWKSNVTSLSSQGPSTSSKLPFPTWKRSSYRRKSSKVFWKAFKYTHILKNNSRIHQVWFPREFLIDCCTGSAEALNSLTEVKTNRKFINSFFFPEIILISLNWKRYRTSLKSTNGLTHFLIYLLKQCKPLPFRKFPPIFLWCPF